MGNRGDWPTLKNRKQHQEKMEALLTELNNFLLFRIAWKNMIGSRGKASSNNSIIDDKKRRSFVALLFVASYAARSRA